jgi:hypothetical protein
MIQEDKQQNTVTVDLVTKQIKAGRLILSAETIKASGTLLANKMLDYVLSGGDPKQLTPTSIFGRKP